MKLSSGIAASLLITCFSLAATQPAAHALIDPSRGQQAESEAALQTNVRARYGHFPFWRNVGQIERSTGFYIGNGMVLTAAHVGPGTFKTWDGRYYPMIPNTVRFFRNRDGSTADLCLFRIHFRGTDPVAKLPAIPLTTTPPRQGNELLLIGAGAGRLPGNPGFAWSDDYRVRWGMNTIQEIYSAPMPTNHYSSFGFATRFENRSQCQAAPGDSGGAVFHYNRRVKRWELAGVIVAVDSDFGGAEFGNQTYIADPALFRRQLAAAAGNPAMLASHR